MFCNNYRRAGIKNEKPMVIADIITKTAPGTMPLKTDGINNVESDMYLAPGSMLTTTNPFKIHLLNDEYEWNEI